MNGFEKISFHGIFRDYQQRVVDNADRYLADGKINIVAAPGSGKTVLGLQLIRHIGRPCIILSPTTAIRQQWGERLKELFLDNADDFDGLFSNDLHDVKTINSITYQALYSAVEKISVEAEDDTDCSDIELYRIIKEKGIGTICLDEAHHLKNEWQKALEKFLTALDKDVKIVSLTATPPYDAEGHEWARYIKVCGEIDEEIFVPELVAQNTLCPHQDYIYFNYPTQNETESFYRHNSNVLNALKEISQLEFIPQLYNKINTETDYEKLFDTAKEYISLLTTFEYFGFEINKRLIKQLTAANRLPQFSLQHAQQAVQFLVDGDFADIQQKTAVTEILKKNMVYDKRQVRFVADEKLKRMLISSAGKLDSIAKIAQSETQAMGGALRMLVLTDYIRKENLDRVATEKQFDAVNVVSIFETLRRNLDETKIGVVSGSLVILPASVVISGAKHTTKAIPQTDYCTVNFAGSLYNAVQTVTKLFEKGDIQILIGTKSLLGEGWDSPCINSLILASFVGSFVQSNQMRGRAIRIDRNNPDKTANIWHLVTVEPEHLVKDTAKESIAAFLRENYQQLRSTDFDTLKRRFDYFMAPGYTDNVIESGIERLSIIRPPFNKEGIDRMNEETLLISRHRDKVAQQWKTATAQKFGVTVETQLPKETKVPVFTFFNVALDTVMAMTAMFLLRPFVSAVSQANPAFSLVGFMVAAVVICVLYDRLTKLAHHINPARSMGALGDAVYRTLRECGLISPYAKVATDSEDGLYAVSMYLKNASVHDQNIFNTAMRELLSPIENPRYIIVAKNIFGRYNYILSFACPSVIGKKKEYAEILAKNLKRTTGRFVPVYTHRENGRSFILKCRKNSYITFNEKMINQKYKVSRWE